MPIGQSWRRNWSRLIPFFDYPPEIRKVIYTTKVPKPRGACGTAAVVHVVGP